MSIKVIRLKKKLSYFCILLEVQKSSQMTFVYYRRTLNIMSEHIKEKKDQMRHLKGKKSEHIEEKKKSNETFKGKKCENEHFGFFFSFIWIWFFIYIISVEEYDTKTRGHRHKPAARALGEGVYRILKHHTGDENKSKKMHTHLIYKLEFPSEETENQPQEALNIEREGSFLIQIKNPVEVKKQEQTKKKKAIFPAPLQAQFGKLRYHAADPPDFLNYEGCEFLLIPASDDVHEELGLEIEGDASCSDLVDTFGDATPADALLKGVWV